MLTIAHRLNTIQASDRILVLSFGTIKEFDSPANLMKDPHSEFNSLLKELAKDQVEDGTVESKPEIMVENTENA